MPRPKPFVALYGQVDFNSMLQVDEPANTDVFVCRQGPEGPNVFQTSAQIGAAGTPDPLLLSNGSSVAPSYSFADHPDTGIFSGVGAIVAVSISGVSQFVFSTDILAGVSPNAAVIRNIGATGVIPTLMPSNSDSDSGIGLTASDQLALIAGGVRVANLTEAAGIVQFIVPLQNNASFPSIAFGDGDTGFYEAADDIIGISIAGVTEFFAQTGLLRGAIIGSGGILNEFATSTNPSLVPSRGDLDTGIGLGGTDQLSLIAGALDCINISESGGARQIGFYVTAPISLQTGVGVTAIALHAALVNLGLITA